MDALVFLVAVFVGKPAAEQAHQLKTPKPPFSPTAMADAPVIAPKSAFEDRWTGIVRPYSQVSIRERD